MLRISLTDVVATTLSSIRVHARQTRKAGSSTECTEDARATFLSFFLRRLCQWDFITREGTLMIEYHSIGIDAFVLYRSWARTSDGESAPSRTLTDIWRSNSGELILTTVLTRVHDSRRESSVSWLFVDDLLIAHGARLIVHRSRPSERSRSHGCVRLIILPRTLHLDR